MIQMITSYKFHIWDKSLFWGGVIKFYLTQIHFLFDREKCFWHRSDSAENPCQAQLNSKGSPQNGDQSENRPVILRGEPPLFILLWSTYWNSVNHNQYIIHLSFLLFFLLFFLTLCISFVLLFVFLHFIWFKRIGVTSGFGKKWRHFNWKMAHC